MRCQKNSKYYETLMKYNNLSMFNCQFSLMLNKIKYKSSIFQFLYSFSLLQILFMNFIKNVFLKKKCFSAHDRTAVGCAGFAGTGSIGAKNMSRSIPSAVMTPTRQTPPELPSKYIACQIAKMQTKSIQYFA